MSSFKTLISKIYGAQLPIRQRFFNIIFTCGFAVGIAGVFACIQLHSSYEAIMVSAAMTFAFPLLAFIGIRSKKNQDKIINFSLAVVNFFIFPALYLTGGEIHCGIPSYFSLGIALTLFLSKGIPGIVLTGAECIFYLFIFFVSWRFPAVCVDVPAFSEGENGVMNFAFQAISSNVFMVCIAIGILAKIIFNMYQKENRVVNESIKKVEEQSTIDPLTAVYNRRYMYSYLKEQVHEAQKTGNSLSVVLFDIDKFKNLNDTYGHLLGDDVLKAISCMIKSSCKENEIVARYGGEEFLLILPGFSKEEAYSRADNIRNCIAKSHLSPDLPENKPVTISGGVATFEPGMNEEAMVQIADENLYIAKDSGRNRIVG